MYMLLALLITGFIWQPAISTESSKLQWIGDDRLPYDVVIAVEQWLSAVSNALVVYRGLDVALPCPSSTEDDHSKLPYLWYNGNNQTLEGVRYTTKRNGQLRITAVKPSDTDNYQCRRQRQRLGEQQLVVIYMPFVAVNFQFVYRVPQCDPMRMSQKADWFSDKLESETRRRADHEDIELTITGYRCQHAIDVRGYQTAYRHYILVLSARLNSIATRLTRYRLLQLQQHACDVTCMQRTLITYILNESLPLLARWKNEELEDKIYGEQRMLYGEMKFPEFLFKPSELTYNISLDCDADATTGYMLLSKSVCVPCAPGFYLNSTTSNCTMCPDDSYQDRLARRRCLQCPDKHYTRQPGATSSTQCLYHAMSLFAHGLPAHYLIFAGIVVFILAFNCLYALLSHRRHLASRVTTRLSRVPAAGADAAAGAGARNTAASPQPQQPHDAEKQALLATDIGLHVDQRH